ncbi:hypothetical protein HHI36_008202 [Cryptolaemus montrouzieri]|uniref:WD repeat protein mio zinc-ribbon like domain-containing protein n=1 Tax=Cryptolaemus montrouzieri TaxID=559131 RepID=A0ABD2MRV7_9CUCU
MSTKLEVIWTPQPNKFITWGTDICLYELQQLRNNSNPNIKLSSTYGANLLATNTNHHYVKCLDIHPKVDSDLLMAIGNIYGKVTLSTFGPSSIFDAQGLPGKDFVPRHSRPCNTVLWNPIDNNVLAVGLEKYRSDFGVLLWDIMKFPTSTENNSGRLSMNTVQLAVELAKPTAEFGISESAHSLDWFRSSSKQMAVGMNNKNIKLLDFRDPNKVVISNLTKAVYGVCVDPHNEKHLASYSDNQSFIWDIRNFEKPILTLSHAKPLLKIEWCPTKYNLLGALQKDSSCITLYDIQHTLVGNEEIEPSVLERNVLPGSPHNITSFSWHASDENRFLTIALSGSIIDYTVFDRITLNWGATSHVVWTYGCKTMKYIQDNTLNDISYKIKKRAKLEYGLKDEFWKNSEIIEDEMLSNVWNWLYLSGKLVDKGVFGDKDIVRGAYCKHPGVQSILKIDPNSNKSEVVNMNWADLGNTNCTGTIRVYRHDDRQKAMRLCSWHFDSYTNALLEFLQQLEKDQSCTRAAAIAVFNLKIKLAIEILGRAPDHAHNGPTLQIVAMALAGFCDDKNSTWKHYCSALRTKLSDPYLKALFAFLTADNYNYDNVLNENGIAVDDRVAFACMFLPDNKLHSYLKKLSETLTEEGNLDGLLLTGTNADGIKLLQKYLDATGDIQSTALIGVQAFSEDINSDAVKGWVESYRNLLDTWQLWNERAKFDIMLSAYRPNEKQPQQVFVSCNFCGKSISACMQGLSRTRGQFTRMGSAANNNLKMSSCPNCRKPLPRCAICLMHMGTKLVL